VLEVEGIDVLDGTPLLDIKPYVPDFDLKDNARAGWYENRPAGKEGRSGTALTGCGKLSWSAWLA
jgi:tRNA (Thr-GGU) A37 N-methylase